MGAMKQHMISQLPSDADVARVGAGLTVAFEAAVRAAKEHDRRRAERDNHRN